MDDSLAALIAPPTATAAAARETLEHFASPAIINHSLRSWVWASTLGQARGYAFDPELLYVSAMIHELGMVPCFDSHTIAFENAGGAVGWVFAAGAGWPAERRTRVTEIIERHMWLDVPVDLDVEGHLLEAATALDVSGSRVDWWDESLLRSVTAGLARMDFTTSFDALMHDQAVRKPETSAKRLDDSARIIAGGATWTEILQR